MFQSREEAGLLLSEKLQSYRGDSSAIIMSIPRGGVIVGKILAQRLNLSLSLVVVKKLGAPNNPELAIGAIAPDGVKVIDWEVSLRSGVEQDYLDEEIERKRREVEEKQRKFEIRNSKFEINHKIQISNYKTIILTDDGVATGATVLAAIKYIKQLSVISSQSSVNQKKKDKDRQPITDDRRLILAVPVIAKDTYNKLKSEVDKIVALEIPESFSAVGQFYEEFPQISDEEVIKILRD